MGCLNGSVGKTCDSWGCKFKPRAGHTAYFKKIIINVYYMVTFTKN